MRDISLSSEQFRDMVLTYKAMTQEETVRVLQRIVDGVQELALLSDGEFEDALVDLVEDMKNMLGVLDEPLQEIYEVDEG